MAARRLSQRDFAEQAGFNSHNYVAIRNRDEKAYTLDDLALIAAFFQEGTAEFIEKAMDSHAEDIYFFAQDELAKVDPRGLDLAADTSPQERAFDDQTEPGED